MRKYTTRINLFLAFAFFLTLASCYTTYLNKLKKDPTLPWQAMFLQIQPQPSWQRATPFNS